MKKVQPNSPPSVSSPDEIMRIVQDAVDSGEFSAEKLAITTNINIERIQQAFNLIQLTSKRERTHDQMLDDHLTLVNDMIETSKMEYDSWPSDKNAAAAASLVQTAQGLIKDSESRQNSGKMAEAIAGRVVQQLIRSFIKGMTVELGKAKTEMLNNIDGGKHHIVDHAINSVMRGLGTLGRKEYQNALGAIALVMGVDMPKSSLLVNEDDKVVALKDKAESLDAPQETFRPEAKAEVS
jgi:hypothetical protein